ncbi:MAG: hypothetical protein LAP21_08140 [Acidobacteriia bacterium]|nr:hypothetical protein [Terriglobia bacterium]
MNSLITRAVKRSVRSAFITWMAAGLLSVYLAGFSQPACAQTRAAEPDLTVHEWGTFTSVAGHDGHAVEWRPLTGSTDLPGFVERFYPALKFGLRGTVRMETPVLYFYSPRALTLSVRVGFSRGMITEWYPHAANSARVEGFSPVSLYAKHADGWVAWDSVTLEPESPAAFPRDEDDSDSDNHYYAARETQAVPLRVHTADGDQREKFLFYRGVSTFPVPIVATFNAQGDLLVRSSGPDEIPDMILFERSGDRIGYRLVSGPQKEALIPPPELTANIESLYSDLEQKLEARGLYQAEAHAMLQTWRNSWFEEGSRLFYIVPAPFVDAILPLTITPAPAQTVRVFVGRMETITPATKKAVAVALANGDKTTLAKFDRFLEPIMQAIKEKNPDRAGISREDANILNSPCNPGGLQIH